MTRRRARPKAVKAWCWATHREGELYLIPENIYDSRQWPSKWKRSGFGWIRVEIRPLPRKAAGRKAKRKA
jgi:hypothetical protein